MIGRSGSGKSTLLRALAGLDRTCWVMTVTEPVRAFQEPRLVPWKRVLDNVTLRLSDANSKSVAAAALAEVGLTERASRLAAYPVRRRGAAGLAGPALGPEPGLLLLDEPFSALDALTRISMHRLVLRLWERHKPAVLLVTHDVDEALALADRVLVLSDGHIAYSVAIDVARPRDRNHPTLVALRLTTAQRARRAADRRAS